MKSVRAFCPHAPELRLLSRLSRLERTIASAASAALSARREKLISFHSIRAFYRGIARVGRNGRKSGDGRAGNESFVAGRPAGRADSLAKRGTSGPGERGPVFAPLRSITHAVSPVARKTPSGPAVRDSADSARAAGRPGPKGESKQVELDRPARAKQTHK